MSIYDPKSVQITIAGVAFDGFTTVTYSAPAAPPMRAGPDGTATARMILCLPDAESLARRILGLPITAAELRHRLAVLRAQEPLPLP